MNVIISPTYPTRIEKPSIFLGGAITGAPDWQSEAIDLLKGTFKTCFNPRRSDGFVTPGKPDYSDTYHQQVKWEHTHLLTAEVVLFWLPKEALAVTTRFEIGWWYGLQEASLEKNGKRLRPFVVGIEDGVVGDTYYRIVLTEIGVQVHSTLTDTCQRAIKLLAMKDYISQSV